MWINVGKKDAQESLLKIHLSSIGKEANAQCVSVSIPWI